MKSLLVFAVALASMYYNKPNVQAGNDSPVPLKPGDKAPALITAKWLKGDSISVLKPGQIYIVEFGFVACGPCRASIPHLTEIARRYKGKVKIISVHIWENNKDYPLDLSYISKVERFIKSMGPKIGYSVGVDVPGQVTAETWGGGAPKVFIIDQNQTIAWIGHPDDMDSVIDQVVSNNFDSRATTTYELNKKLRIKAFHNAAWSNKLMGKFQLAIDQMDSLIVENPDMPWFYYEKYRLLDGMDAGNSRADSLVKWLLKNKPKNFRQMYELSHAIIESKYPDYDVAIETADWAAEKSNYYFSTAFILDVKAEAYFKKGNLQKAIQIQNEAINLMLPYASEVAEPLKSLQLRLMFYQKQLK